MERLRRAQSAIARHLAAQGAKVALGARRQGHLDKIVSEIVAAGGQAFEAGRGRDEAR
jgi:NADP-dependent 3-hydroxy acid dehydrogenase YdfG